jgi:hypothetical protein
MSIELPSLPYPHRLLRLSLLVFGLAALPGCAYIQGQIAADSQEILAQAGFERKPLDEPGLPSRQLIEQAGAYKFADPDFCRCAYVGGADEHAEQQRLRAERLAEREWILGRMVAAGNIDRTMWGPWKPEGLDVVSRTAPILPAPSAAAR